MISALTTSADSTRAFASALSSAVVQTDLVLLAGELGAGKTTFTQGFGSGLGVTEQITSPTFVLLRTYDAPIKLLHADVYRLENLQEVIDLGLLELLDEGGVALIEWGDLAAPVIPRDYLEVRLSADETNEDHRHIRLNVVGNRWSAREKLLAETLAEWTVETKDVGDEQ